MPPLSRADGTPTGAVYGFINMLLKLTDAAKTDYMAVIFDAGRQTFRNRIYPEYKAHRPPAPEDLIPQFSLVRDAVEAFNIPAIELTDYEADDIIATYTKMALQANMEVVIVSSDKDLMQLVGEHVSMYDGMKQKTITTAEVQEKFGVLPQQVRDVLALIGDASDNVPGVPSIGAKTAAELILHFGSFEALLDRHLEIPQPKRREAIANNLAQARMSYELIGLCETVPDLIALEELKLREPDAQKFLAFLKLMEFGSLVSRMEKIYGVKAEVPKVTQNRNYQLVSSEAELTGWIAKATHKGIVAFDTETTSLNAMQAELVGFSLCVEAGEACYVPLNHKTIAQKQASLFEAAVKSERLAGQLDEGVALALLKPMLEDDAILKIGHNIKYDALVMDKYGITINAVDDTMLLSYLCYAGVHNHAMDELAQRYLGIKTISYDEVTGTGKNRINFSEVSLEKALDYAAEDADVTLQLWHYFKPKLCSDHLVTLYETIERPLINVLLAMEKAGIRVDKTKLAGLASTFQARLAVLERSIYEAAGRTFTIGSPKQLGEILFDELKLEGGKKSKTGSYATGVEVLEELLETGHPLPQLILDWRQLTKLQNTYVETLPQQINPKTLRIHTSYAMASTTTGRLSSSDPNLQNIPIRSEEGRKIRGAFVAEAGNKLISCDYSQIELRLLAHIADIAVLKTAFKNGEDIHAITASQLFHVDVAEVNNDLRRKAKTINFGIIYGISGHGLAVRLGISRSEANDYIQRYFEQYPGIKQYMETTKQFAREHGYVVTLFGRKCHVNGINDKNGAMRSFSERAAINAPLQGTAADIIKRAMIKVHKVLENQPARMLLQVHDELIIEAKTEMAEVIAWQVVQAMETAAYLTVPLTVSRNIGDSWEEVH